MKRFLVILLCFAAFSLVAETLNFTHFVDAPTCKNKVISVDSDVRFIADPGAPRLPYKTSNVLLPFGEKITSIEVNMDDPVVLDGHFDLDQVQQQIPIQKGRTQEFVRTPRNEEIYNSSVFFPEYDHKLVTVQRMNGFDLAFINIYPYKYNPETEEIMYFNKVEVFINTEYDASIANEQSKRIINNSRIHDKFKNLILNPDAVNSYPDHATVNLERDSQIDPNDPKKMIIITDQAHIATFQDFASYKESNGVSTGVFDIAVIYSDYTGLDHADQMRQFIDHAYTSWANSSTDFLEYVILAGDDEIIPFRLAVANNGNERGYIPCDLYFGALDGTWNDDGDGFYGEFNDGTDLTPEVHIGRMPGDITQDFLNMIAKSKEYENTFSHYHDTALFIGEKLDNDGQNYSYGSSYKNAIAQEFYQFQFEYDMKTLYERYNTFSQQGVEDEFNRNHGSVINHVGHCDYPIAMGLTRTEAFELSNTKFPIVYSIGCYSLAFDDSVSGADECIGENLMVAPGGLAAYVGNTRYGFYSRQYVTDATSYKFDKTFFHDIMEEGNYNIGSVLTNSKLPHINDIDNGVFRWVYYELVLFGDPSLEYKRGYGDVPNLVFEDGTTGAVESPGDGDGKINPGERAALRFTLSNNTILNEYNMPVGGSATGINITVMDDDNVTGLGTANIGDLAIDSSIESANASASVLFRLNSDCATGVFDIIVKVEAGTDASTGRNYVEYHHVPIQTGFEYAGFPINIDDADVIGAPVITDINNDNVKEVIFCDEYSKVYAFNADGSALAGFPVAGSSSGNSKASIAVADIDGDGNKEIAVTHFLDGNLKVINNDGSMKFQKDNLGFVFTTPVFADFTTDSGLETIIAGSPNENNQIMVYDKDGNSVANFPVNLTASVRVSVTVADIDNDGANEIVAATASEKLAIIESDGTVSYVDLEGFLSVDPVVFDSDKIVVGNNAGKVFVVQNGQIIHSREFNSQIIGSFAIADVNGDSNNDIILSLDSKEIFAVDSSLQNLTGSWPVTLPHDISTSPVIADINADDLNDIILVDDYSSLFVYNGDGTSHDGYPVAGVYQSNGLLTVDNLDMDRNPDIFIGAPGKLLGWDIKTHRGHINKWHTFKGSYSRNGSVSYIVDNDNSDVNNYETAVTGNYPNPFNPETTIAFSINQKDSSQPALLQVYNIKGQLVKTLDNKVYSEGSHTIVWSGKDNSEKSVGTGVYFFRLRTASTVQTSKMLLLK